MLKCSICEKEFETYRQLNGHKSTHSRDNEYRLKRASQLRSPTPKQVQSCRYCDRQSTSLVSNAQHEIYCKHNPAAKTKAPTYGMQGKTAWNKGLTKETDLRVAAIAEANKGKPGSFLNKTHTVESKEKIAQTRADKGYRSYVRSTRCFYKGILLDSTWELELAKDLDTNGVQWVRPGALSYLDNTGQRRLYYPDFFLPDYNVYLDPKNLFVQKRDKMKISSVQTQNNVLIYCLNKSQLSWNEVQKLIR